MSNNIGNNKLLLKLFPRNSKRRGFAKQVYNKMFSKKGDIEQSGSCSNVNFVQQKQDSVTIAQNISFRLKNAIGNGAGNITQAIDVYNECVGCSACKNICPKSAIELVPNKDGFLNPKIDSAKCVSCRLCVNKCPILHVQYDNLPRPECYAAIANDELRKVSSSGGAFSVFADYVFEHGGFVCGAVFDKKFKVHHIITDSKTDLEKMRGSKYYQSDLLDVFSKIKEKLKLSKIVLFSGMPCQIAGLKSFLGTKYDNLYTIEILCHGVSSYKVFKKYWQDVLGGKTILDLKFKAKKPWGWHAGVNAYFADGTHYAKPLEKDPYFRAYFNVSKNATCYSCKYNRLPRQGDITLADFWRVHDYDIKLNDNKGTSLVLVNNNKGKHLFKLCIDKFKLCTPVPIKYAIKGNPVIVTYYPLTKNRKYFFENLDSLDFVTNLRNSIGAKNSHTDIKKYKKSNNFEQQSGSIVLEKFVLSKNGYHDSCGNSINGEPDTKLKKVIFRGSNNHIIIGKNVKLDNIECIDLSNNNLICIGNNVSFNGETKIELLGDLLNGTSILKIGNGCVFNRTVLKMSNSINYSKLLIGDNCTFDDNVCFYVNGGRKIIIGSNCAFSKNIDLLGNDYSTINLDEDNTNNDFNDYIVIGEHVRINFNVTISPRTFIGDGSIINAGSVVGGIFANNCVIEGNPAKIEKTNVSWSKGNYDVFKNCDKYIYPTMNKNILPIIDKKVLIIGGTRQNGEQLVKKLLSYGNDVTIATRGIKNDNFGFFVRRLTFDVLDATSTKKALLGKKYDVVFHNLAYNSTYVKNILDFVKCDRCVQLSSIAVYNNCPSLNIKEDVFDSSSEKFNCGSDYKNYGIGKRNAESILFQRYEQIPSVAVRIPFVVPTVRLDYFCDCIINSVPMAIRDINKCLCFITAPEIADFLVWVANQKTIGPVNLSSRGYVKIIDIINYIEKKTNKVAIVDPKNGKDSPFHEEIVDKSLSLNLNRIKSLGYTPLKIDDWFWNVLDLHIARALNKNK